MGNHTATESLKMTDQDIDFSTGEINFSTTTRQMINLYGTSFGIGVQNATLYNRTQGNFAWYRGGIHDDGPINSGGGGISMVLTSAGNLGLGGITNPTSRLHIAGNSTHIRSGTPIYPDGLVADIESLHTYVDDEDVNFISEQDENNGFRGGFSFYMDDDGTQMPLFQIHNKSNTGAIFQVRHTGKLDLPSYGSGTFTGTETGLLGVDAAGAVVEVNSLKASKVFYPPSIAIDASVTGTFTVDLYAQYIAQFGSPVVSSAGAIPTYNANELDYHVTYADPAVFNTATMALSAAGVLTYTVDAPPADYNSLINVVFVVK